MFEVETVTCKSLTSLSLSISLSLSLSLSSSPLSSLPLECMIKHLLHDFSKPIHSVTSNNLVTSFWYHLRGLLRMSNVPRLHMQIWLNSWVSLYVHTHTHTPVLGGYHLFWDIHRIRISTFLSSVGYYIFIIIIILNVDILVRCQIFFSFLIRPGYYYCCFCISVIYLLVGTQ